MNEPQPSQPQAQAESKAEPQAEPQAERQTQDVESDDVAHQISVAVQRALRRRVTHRGTLARKVEDRAKRGGERLWALLKRHPYAGVGAAGAAGLAAALAIGAGELAIGAAVAYGAFEILVRGEPPEVAARDVAKEMEHA